MISLQRLKTAQWTELKPEYHSTLVDGAQELRVWISKGTPGCTYCLLTSPEYRNVFFVEMRDAKERLMHYWVVE